MKIFNDSELPGRLLRSVQVIHETYLQQAGDSDALLMHTVRELAMSFVTAILSDKGFFQRRSRELFPHGPHVLDCKIEAIVVTADDLKEWAQQIYTEGYKAGMSGPVAHLSRAG